MSGEVKRVTASYIQDLAKRDTKNEYKFLSPVNLNLDAMTKIELPELKWLNLDSEPQSTKVANTGQTVIVSGSWSKNRPRITGGPLLTTYVFSQLHYHWGSDNTHGSEHSYNNQKVPLEMHAVFLKENCLKQEEALAEKDGAVVISFAYKLDDEPNAGLQLVSDELQYIPNPNQLIELQDPVKLTTFICPFKGDYFMYWGSVRTNACKHILLWILCRQPYVVNEKQLNVFRSLFTSGHQPIMNNARLTHEEGYEVFHVNPSAFSEDVLYKKVNNNVSKKVLTPERIRERQRQHKSSKSASSRTSSESSDEEKSKKQRSDSSSVTGRPMSSMRSATKMSIDGKSKRSVIDPARKVSETSTVLAREENKKEKLQSHYQKLFSVPDRLEKMKQMESKSNSNDTGKGDVTVMNVNVKNDFYKKQKKLANNEMSNSKDKGLLKNITQNYVEARTKFKNDIFMKDANDEELDVDSLKYINIQNNKDEVNKGLLAEFGDKDVDSNITSRSSKIRDKEVTFNSSLNVDTTKCYNITKGLHGDVLEKDDLMKEKFVHDIGINTMTFDELLNSMTVNRSRMKHKKITTKRSDVTMCSGSGDESTSTISDQRNKTIKLKGNEKDVSKIKPKLLCNTNSKRNLRNEMVTRRVRSKTPSEKTPHAKRFDPKTIKERTGLSGSRSVSPGSGSSKYSNSSKTSVSKRPSKPVGSNKSLRSAKKRPSKVSIKDCNPDTDTKSDRRSTLLPRKPLAPLLANSKRVHKDEHQFDSKEFDSTSKEKKLVVKDGFKSKIPSMINRSKSNLSYRSFVKPRTPTSRPLTPSPGTMKKLAYPESAKSSNINSITTKANEDTCATMTDSSVTHNENVESNEDTLSNLPMSSRGGDKTQMLKVNNVKTNDEVSDWSSSSCIDNSKNSPRRRNFKCLNSKLIDKEHKRIKNISNEESENCSIFSTEQKSSNTSLSKQNSDMESKGNATEVPSSQTDVTNGKLRSLMLHKDSIQVINEKLVSPKKELNEVNPDPKPNVRQQLKSYRFSMNRSAGRPQTRLIEEEVSNESTMHISEMPPLPETSHSEIHNECNNNCSTNIKPSVNKPKVFNKIPIKIQKPTPVHTWRY